MTSRNFLFKIYNPTEEDVPSLKWKNSKYIIYQKERNVEGIPFFQGHVVFKTAVRMTHVKKLNRRAKWSFQKDVGMDHNEAVQFCSKEEGRIEPPIVCGAMYDVERSIKDCFHCNPPSFRDAQAMGMAENPQVPLQDIQKLYPDLWQAHQQTYENMRSLTMEAQSEEKPMVYWFWGSDREKMNQKILSMISPRIFEVEIKVNSECKKTDHPDIIRTHESVTSAFELNADISYRGNQFGNYWGEEDVIVINVPSPSDHINARNGVFQIVRQSTKMNKQGVRAKRVFVAAPHPPPEYFEGLPPVCVEEFSALVDVIEEVPASETVLGKRVYAGSYVEGFEPPPQKRCTFKYV